MREWRSDAMAGEGCIGTPRGFHVHGLRVLVKTGLVLTTSVAASLSAVGPAECASHPGHHRITNAATERRLLHRRQEGLFPRCRHCGDDDGVRLGGADDRAARHRPARMSAPAPWRPGSTMRSSAASKIRGRCRQGLDRGRLRVFHVAGSQGFGRQRPLQDARRSARADDLDRRSGQRLGVLAQRSAQKGRAEFADVNVVYMGFPEMLAAFRNKASMPASPMSRPSRAPFGKALRCGRARRSSIRASKPRWLLFAESFANSARSRKNS